MRFFTAAILILVLGGLVAAGAYEAGIAQGSAQIVVAAPGAAPAVGYNGHPYGWGFGYFPFGFLFPIFGIFLFFALMRALVGGGRGYGHHRGWYNDDHSVPGRFEEWHTRAHGETTSGTVPPRQ